MAGNRGSVLGIIALIIGASGLGLGAFSIVNFQAVEGPQGPPGEDGIDGIDGIDGVDGLNGINGTLDNLVAIWENLTASASSHEYYIRFSDIRLNNSEYFTMINDYTVNLTKAGWYRFTLKFLWCYLIAGTVYYTNLQKNGSVISSIDRINPEDSYHMSISVVYLSSDGNDTFRYQCIALGPESFTIYPGQQYNQFVIEYVGEL